MTTTSNLPVNGVWKSPGRSVTKSNPYCSRIQRIQQELRSLGELADRSRAESDPGQVREREQQIESVREGAQR